MSRGNSAEFLIEEAARLIGDSPSEPCNTRFVTLFIGLIILIIAQKSVR